MLERVKPEYIRRTYGIEKWADATDFLEQAPRSRRDLAEIAIAEITEESTAEMHPLAADVPLLDISTNVTLRLDIQIHRSAFTDAARAEPPAWSLSLAGLPARELSNAAWAARVL